MNQYFSVELSQKVSRGIRESWNKGYCTGQRLFGYDVVDKKYVINEYEAAVVKEIFVKYSQGIKARTILNDLLSRGIKRKNGKPLNENYVYYILHNVRYTGKIEHDGKIYDNIFPPIVSQEIWTKVKGICDENKKAPGRKKEIFGYILSGKLFCGKCLHRMCGISGTSHTGDVHYYYICGAKHKRKNKCKMPQYQKQPLEDLIVNTTVNMLNKNGNIEKIAEGLYALHQKEANDNTVLKSLKKQRNAAVKASNNLIRAVEQGIITEQTKTRLKELETQIAGLDFEIEKELQKTFVSLSPAAIEKYLRSKICENTRDIQVRKLLVNTFIREIILFEDKIIITYNFTDLPDKTKHSEEQLHKIVKQAETATLPAFSFPFGSYKLIAAAPDGNYPNTTITQQWVRVVFLLPSKE